MYVNITTTKQFTYGLRDIQVIFIDFTKDDTEILDEILNDFKKDYFIDDGRKKYGIYYLYDREIKPFSSSSRLAKVLCINMLNYKE